MATQSISSLVGRAPRQGPEGAIDALLAIAASAKGQLQLTRAPRTEAGQFDGQYVAVAYLSGHAPVHFRVDVAPATKPRVWAFESAYQSHDDTPGVELSAAEIRALRLHLERHQPKTRMTALLTVVDEAVPQPQSDWSDLDVFDVRFYQNTSVRPRPRPSTKAATWRQRRSRAFACKRPTATICGPIAASPQISS